MATITNPTLPGGTALHAPAARPGLDVDLDLDLDLDLADLTDLVRCTAADESHWRPLVRYAETGRWWTRLSGDDTVDVWLLSWLRDQTTDLHDHGGSRAAFTVVQGALHELRPAGEGLTNERIAPGRIQWVAPGVVHDVGNPWTTPAVSIHAYSPPLTSMTYYRRGRHGLTAVETRATDGPER
jgi:hypothetical protein